MKNLSVVAALAGLALATPAQAADYLFEITGDYYASFVLPSDPIPSDSQEGLGFVLNDVEGFPDALFGIADVFFYTADALGGLEIGDYYGETLLFSALGPQLYSGTEDAPTFLTGTYALNEFEGTGTYSLTISEVSAAVPETATWAMMIAGFALTGAALRRRKPAVTVNYAFA